MNSFSSDSLLRLSKKEKDAGLLSYYEQGFGKHSADPKYQKNIAFVHGGVAGLWWFPTG